MTRIVGLETEYGCLCEDPAGPASAVGLVRNWIYENRRYGLSDVFQRDWDEPPGNGGFLFNGGRAYVDMGHLEYCTPECLSLRDLLLYDRAGDHLINEALQDLGLQHRVGFVRNNVDHYSGATFGCHENYLVRRSAPLSERNILSVLLFLTLRVLYTGAGRVGSSLGAENRGDHRREGADPHFQISQRADYINNELFEWVQFNRAIINTRDEPLADARRFRRLHLLHGDTSVLPTTLALKAGTTSLVLDLLELDHLPQICLADAVGTFRQLSHQTLGPWEVTLATGETENAIGLLRRYHSVAHAEFHGRDPETTAILALWSDTLDRLESDPSTLVGRVDWITKHWLFTRFLEQESLGWDHPWLRSQDLEFHHLDPGRSLGLSLDQTPDPWRFTEAEVNEVRLRPPADTRAHARSQLMRRIAEAKGRYFVDWEVVDLEGHDTLHLLDPFDPVAPDFVRAVPVPEPISSPPADAPPADPQR
ncbi:MAG: proteasome accessory factor PafA2 family protein [Verrucomicrobiales bacterium]|nr:proteasome accessory factor PafA2 family protein [Verrucomicrobiales bacterium]